MRTKPFVMCLIGTKQEESALANQSDCLSIMLQYFIEIINLVCNVIHTLPKGINN